MSAPSRESARAFLRTLSDREALLGRQVSALERLASLNEERADCLKDDRAIPYSTMASNYRLLVTKLLENHMTDFNMIYTSLQISTLDFPPIPKYPARQDP